jgi:hypothetical protein
MKLAVNSSVGLRHLANVSANSFRTSSISVRSVVTTSTVTSAAPPRPRAALHCAACFVADPHFHRAPPRGLVGYVGDLPRTEARLGGWRLGWYIRGISPELSPGWAVVAPPFVGGPEMAKGEAQKRTSPTGLQSVRMVFGPAVCGQRTAAHPPAVRPFRGQLCPSVLPRLRPSVPTNDCSTGSPRKRRGRCVSAESSDAPRASSPPTRHRLAPSGRSPASLAGQDRGWPRRSRRLLRIQGRRSARSPPHRTQLEGGPGIGAGRVDRLVRCRQVGHEVSGSGSHSSWARLAHSAHELLSAGSKSSMSVASESICCPQAVTSDGTPATTRTACQHFF